MNAYNSITDKIVKYVDITLNSQESTNYCNIYDIQTEFETDKITDVSEWVDCILQDVSYINKFNCPIDEFELNDWDSIIETHPQLYETAQPYLVNLRLLN